MMELREDFRKELATVLRKRPSIGRTSSYDLTNFLHRRSDTEPQERSTSAEDGNLRQSSQRVRMSSSSPMSGGDPEGRRTASKQQRSSKKKRGFTLRSFNSYCSMPGSAPGSDDEASPVAAVPFAASEPSFGHPGLLDDTQGNDAPNGITHSPTQATSQHTKDDVLVDIDDDGFAGSPTAHGDNTAAEPLLPHQTSSGITGMRSASKMVTAMSFYGTEEWGSFEEIDIETCYSRCCKKAKVYVNSQAFENVVGFAVVISAFILGFEVDNSSRTVGEPTPVFYKAADWFFFLFFAIEISLRMAVNRHRFFTMIGKEWNVFDLIMVILQAVDVFVQTAVPLNLEMAVGRQGQNMGVVRVVRLLRMVRVMRLFRTFHLFSELRIMVASMSSALGSLLWSMLLQLVIVYVFAVIFLQVVTTYRREGDNEDLDYWFGSLLRSMLTMVESILSGVSWDCIVQPLNEEISPFMGTLFVMYVAASMFAMMNLVTGLFVTEVLTKVNEDKDENFINELSTLFAGNRRPAITKQDFLDHTQKPVMMKYLKSLDIHPGDAFHIFDILDINEDGQLDRDELFEAFLRLRGPARQVDMQVLRKELQDLAEAVSAGLRPGSPAQGFMTALESSAGGMGMLSQRIKRSSSVMFPMGSELGNHGETSHRITFDASVARPLLSRNVSPTLSRQTSGQALNLGAPASRQASGEDGPDETTFL